MQRRLLVLSLAAVLPPTALAQSTQIYQCTMGNLTRRVEIVHATAAPVPCEVGYVKESEASGERQVLWSAGAEAGYCEAQASELVARLGGMGWQCTGPSGTPAAAPTSAPPPPAAAEPEVADDTDALSAPE